MRAGLFVVTIIAALVLCVAAGGTVTAQGGAASCDRVCLQGFVEEALVLNVPYHMPSGWEKAEDVLAR